MPLQTSKISLATRLKHAQSIEELEQLFKLSFAFREASSKTIRRWKEIFDRRKQQLLSL